MKEKTVRELHPRRFPGHRLTGENALYGMLPCHTIVIESGTFFNKLAHKMREGWILRGWATPPHARGDADAIVFEKTTPASTAIDFWESREPGIYWLHDYAGSLRILV